MSANPAYVPVAAAPARPPLVGLIASAYIPPANETDDFGQPVGDRWINGFAWRPDVGPGLVGYDDCTPAGGTAYSTQLVPDPGEPGVQYYDPYAIDATAQCSTMGLGEQAYNYLAARAQRKLLLNESFGIARELLTGRIARDTGRDNNRWLQSPSTVVLNPGITWANSVLTGATSGNAVDAKRGLAMLEQNLGTCRSGSRGMMHVPRELVQPLGVRQEGNLLLSNIGTIIVPDAAYDGTGPDGSVAPAGTAWAYGTGIVTVRRSAITLTPEPTGPGEADPLAEMIARNVNTAAVAAWRYAAATWDGYCAFAVLTTLD